MKMCKFGCDVAWGTNENNWNNNEIFCQEFRPILAEKLGQEFWPRSCQDLFQVFLPIFFHHQELYVHCDAILQVKQGQIVF